MKKTMKRIATVGLALMMTTSLIACGKKQPPKDIDDMTDSELEQSLNEILEEYESDKTVASETKIEPEVEEVTELTFEPLDEIKSATLYDIKLQVFDDIVYPYKDKLDDLIDRLGDKYDFSIINPDDFINTNNSVLTVARKDNPSYQMELYLYDSVPDHTRVGDTYLINVDTIIQNKSDNQYIWIPGGIPGWREYDSTPENYQTILETFNSLGITENDEAISSHGEYLGPNLNPNEGLYTYNTGNYFFVAVRPNDDLSGYLNLIHEQGYMEDRDAMIVIWDLIENPDNGELWGTLY